MSHQDHINNKLWAAFKDDLDEAKSVLTGLVESASFIDSNSPQSRRTQSGLSVLIIDTLKIKKFEEIVERVDEEYEYKTKTGKVKKGYRKVDKIVEIPNIIGQNRVHDILDKLHSLGFMNISTRTTNGEDYLHYTITKEGREVIEKYNGIFLDSNKPISLDKVNRALGELICGEERLRCLVFLISYSSFVKHCAQNCIVIGDSSSGKTYVTTAVTNLFPKDMLLKFTRMSKKAPEYLFKRYDTLTGKIWMVEQLDGLEDAQNIILPLLSGQGIRLAVVDKDAKEVQILETKGFPVLLTTSTEHPKVEMATRTWLPSPDSSIRQSKRIVEFIKELEFKGIDYFKLLEISNFLDNALEDANKHTIVIPYIRWLEVPVDNIRIRRDFNKLLSLIKIVTHFNRRYRPIEGDIIVSTLADYHIVLQIAEEFLLSSMRGLSKTSLETFEALKVASKGPGNEVTVRQVDRELNRMGISLSNRTIRKNLQSLYNGGRVTISKEGRNNIYSYHKDEVKTALPDWVTLKDNIDQFELIETISKICPVSRSRAREISHLILNPEESEIIKLFPDEDKFIVPEDKSQDVGSLTTSQSDEGTLDPQQALFAEFAKKEGSKFE